jgi:general secretion pathway protein M
MTTSHPIDRHLARHPGVAVLAFLALVGALVTLAMAALADIGERRRSVEASAEMLARLEGRTPGSRRDLSDPAATAPVGSPFLEGQTITVAGAALLQRVAGAVTRVGGSVLSSQIELQGVQSKDGYVSLVASCELEQPALQQLLYDIEAGMPFLFVDQLVAQAPLAGVDGGRMRVLLGVSGLWPGAK